MDGKVNTLKMVPIIADDDFIKVFNLEMIKGNRWRQIMTTTGVEALYSVPS